MNSTKRKFSRWIAILAVLALALSLAACNNTPASTSSQPAPSGSQSSQEDVKKENTGIATLAPYDEIKDATGEPIELGVFASLTGANAAGGNCMYNGMLLACKYINAHGGVNGRPLKFITYDDTSTAEGAVKAVTRLIDQDEVPMMLGSQVTSCVLAAMPYIEEGEVLALTNGTGLGFTKVGNKWLFRSSLNDIDANVSTMNIIKELGLKNVGFIYAECDKAQNAYKQFQVLFEQNNVEILSTVSYQKGENDFTGHIQKLIANDPQAVVVMVNSYTETAQFIKQLRQQGYDGLVFGPDSSLGAMIRETAGDLATGLIFSAAVPPMADPKEAYTEYSKYVLQLYLDEYGEPIANDNGFRGWDCVMLAAEALRNASDVTDSAAIRKALIEIKDYEGVQGTFDFTAADGDGLPNLNKWVIIDQKVVPYTKEKVVALNRIK